MPIGGWSSGSPCPQWIDHGRAPGPLPRRRAPSPPRGPPLTRPQHAPTTRSLQRPWTSRQHPFSAPHPPKQLASTAGPGAQELGRPSRKNSITTTRRQQTKQPAFGQELPLGPPLGPAWPCLATGIFRIGKAPGAPPVSIQDSHDPPLSTPSLPLLVCTSSTSGVSYRVILTTTTTTSSSDATSTLVPRLRTSSFSSRPSRTPSLAPSLAPLLTPVAATLVRQYMAVRTDKYILAVLPACVSHPAVPLDFPFILWAFALLPRRVPISCRSPVKPCHRRILHFAHTAPPRLRERPTRCASKRRHTAKTRVARTSALRNQLHKAAQHRSPPA